MDETTPGLFEAVGIEIEYAIVDSATLDVRPIADKLLFAADPDFSEETERGPICWSNEQMLHMIEFKTNGPAPSLDSLADDFYQGVKDANELLLPMGARLMPGAMHPWMNPETQMLLWPHEYSPVYEKYNEIFNCRGHGWANLHSMHVNLPFKSDEQFARLHAAVRLLLPAIPALSASSPFADSVYSGFRDFRMEVYRNNSNRVPSVAGGVIPEPFFSRSGYERGILERIYRDMENLDPEGILRYEWMNSRGAIARFDRSAIEIRVIDSQECPASDIAIAALIFSALREFVSEKHISFDAQKKWDTDSLKNTFLRTIRYAEDAAIEADYAEAFGLSSGADVTGGAFWKKVYENNAHALLPEMQTGIECILDEGTLSTRLLKAAGEKPGRDDLERVYRRLCECLDRNELFHA